MKVVYNWLKEYVGEEMPSVEKLDELFTFHAFEIDGIEKVGNEDVIDVKVLPDRSSDCLSHRGIARELSSLTGTPLQKDPFTEPATLAPQSEKLKITIHDTHACRRFATALVTGVTIKESPTWLCDRLETLGQRSINNVVDATNYVMLALGQPLHAYDAAKFSTKDGVWHYGVRMAEVGETITTLSNETYTLTDAVQIITDESNNTPAGIAGIKGGKYAEIDLHTTNIILEAANFDPQITRKATQALKLQTDASKRFENNLSPELVPYALRDVVALILDIAGGVCEGYADVFPHTSSNTPVTVTLSHINALLGLTLTTEIIENIFSRLGFGYSREGEEWNVTAPFERTDITIAEDLIAEVGRVYGYEHVHTVMPPVVPLTEYNARHYYSEKIRHILVQQGFSEVITSSFRKKDAIELQNALASDKGCLRSTLKNNIQEVLDRNITNIDLLGIARVQVFEIGTVFYKTADGTDVTEHVSLALGVRTKQQGYTPKDDARLKEVLALLEEEIGISFRASVETGVLECNLTQLVASLPQPTAYDVYTPQPQMLFTPYSSYPFISRDIALWVPETTQVGDIESLIHTEAGSLLIRVTLFDEFKKENRISYAFRLIFQSFEKTLTDDEIGVVMDAIIAQAKTRGFEVR